MAKRRDFVYENDPVSAEDGCRSVTQLSFAEVASRKDGYSQNLGIDVMHSWLVFLPLHPRTATVFVFPLCTSEPRLNQPCFLPTACVISHTTV